VRESGYLATFVEGLNRRFNLPVVLSILLGSDRGPLYDPSSATIHIPYSFVLGTTVSTDGALSDEELGSAANMLMFVLHHELGHALFDILDLRGLENEEEAADALATVLAIEFGNAGPAIAAAATTLYRARGTGDRSSEWAAHSLTLERYQRLMCWVAGSEGGDLVGLAEEAGIPSQRLEKCPEEYQELNETLLSWLEPHLKY
jgi:hypothetical protein